MTTIKARQNRIRLQKRRPRIRMVSNPAPVAWILSRFVDVPVEPEDVPYWCATYTGGAPTGGDKLRFRERFRLLGWIFRLLRR